MAYGDESNRLGLCHGGDDLEMMIITCALAPMGPSQWPLSEMGTICAHFADVIIERRVGAGVQPPVPSIWMLTYL